LIISIVLVFFSSCIKNKEKEFPLVPVNFTINLLGDPAYLMLQAQGNAQLIINTDLGHTNLGYGNNGIIVYNAGGGEFLAFDATCPYDLPEIIAVELSGTSGVVVCPKCKTRYLLPGYGMPTVEGPADYPLHEYQTFFNPNTYNLLITN
jgi:nitrite reductase/ring-hydroxylating ferredoxin subunit